MLFAAFIFLLLSIIAGIFGFTGVASVASSIAQILFGIFIIGFIITIVIHLARRRNQL